MSDDLTVGGAHAQGIRFYTDKLQRAGLCPECAEAAAVFYFEDVFITEERAQELAALVCSQGCKPWRGNA